MPTTDSAAGKRWYEVLGLLTPLILGVCVTGVGAVFTHVYNDRQLQINQLTALDKLRPLLESEKPLEREFGYQMFAALGYEHLALKLIQLKNDSAGRPVAQVIAISGNAAAKSEASAVLLTVPARVYLHIAADSQRPRATELQEVLLQKGFATQGIENVTSKAPKRTDIRYFNDQDRPTAEAIAGVLKEKGISNMVVNRVSGLSARPGSLEVWFAEGSF